MVVRGGDGALWSIRHESGPWVGWTSLGGRTTDRPAVGYGPAGLTVSVRGEDGKLWERSRLASGAWAPWHSAGRAIVGGPGANSYRDAAGRIWVRRFETGWQWEVVPALPSGVRPASEPAVVRWSGLVLVRGSDGQAWSWEREGTGAWLALGGRFISGVAGAYQADGVTAGQWVYGRGTNGKLYVTGTFYPPGWTLLS